MALLESPALPLPGFGRMLRSGSRHNLVNGAVGMLFAGTGPMVILLKAATDGGLSAADINSYVFAAFAFGGMLTILASVAYRQPIAIMWTIPGAVLAGAALDHLSLPEVLGACFASGLIMLVLGLSGGVSRLMAALPLPIVMGMVAGVFLPFGLGIVAAFESTFLMALAMLAAFLACQRFAVVGRVFPPVLAALLAGAAVLAAGDQAALDGELTFALARPQLYLPVFSWQAIAELAIPLTVTVVGIHNAQGFVILRQAGYEPPQNVLTAVCGGGTLLFGLFGSVPTCVTGPANAILNTSGPLPERYLSGVVFGLIAIAYGLAAPLMVSLGLALPTAFIAMLGGLAMLQVLQGAFVTAFSGRFTLGALSAFIVTLSGVSIVNIGAPFWGLVFGVGISLVLEMDDFRALRAGRR